MAKCADQYFDTNDWSIQEYGFDPEYSRVSESVFSLANGYMGVRGCFEEGYSGDTLKGSYFNGIYERRVQKGQSYKGITDTTEFMVNAADWLWLRIEAEGEELDLARSDIRSFQRSLYLKNGVLSRSFLWMTKMGKKIEVELERFLSMERIQTGAQRVCIRALDQAVTVTIKAGIDFSNPHDSIGENLWKCSEQVSCDGMVGILGTTVSTGQKVYAAACFDGSYDALECQEPEEKRVFVKMRFSLNEGEKKGFTRIAKNLTCKHLGAEDELEEMGFEGKKQTAFKELQECRYEVLKEENFAWWAQAWERSDIVIRGDEENQQGIRYCIFQMYQTYHGGVDGNIGAKGLTGEAYNGNAFWDTETYCLPFYVFNDLKAARKLLKFRYDTLSEAKERAKELDCQGAFYPIATISGRECCNLWQHASLQLQASTAVVYGIWFYQRITGDLEFLYEYGMEMLIEVCRMLATRGSFTEGRKRYGFYCVMGPDEFQMMVNHNCYTNLMGKFTFEYTERVMRQLEERDRERWEAVVRKTDLKDGERRQWNEMALRMYIPYEEETQLFEQHQGFFSLPHVDVDAIPVSDFPLYEHWSYDRIYRNDMVKQPDVLMFFLMFPSGFTREQLRRNYEYYEPRCIHESSLSPSVHSILASRLKKHEEAYDFFRFATRMDLDNYNRNTREGLHTTSIAAAWMNIVYGFGGMQSDGKCLSLSPSIPEQWQSYSFRLSCRDDVILVEVEKEKVSLYTLKGKNIRIQIYGEEVVLGKEALSRRMRDRNESAGKM